MSSRVDEPTPYALAWDDDGGARPFAATRRSAGALHLLLALFAFGVAVDAMPLFGLDTTAVLFGTVLIVAAAWRVVTTGHLRRPSATLLTLTGYVAWLGITLLWTRDQPTARDRITTFLQLLASTWFLWQVARDERDLRAILGGYVAGCLFAVGGAWHSFATGLTYRDLDAQRFVAQGFDPNDMGVTLAIGIPMAAFLALDGRSRLRWLWILYVPLALSGIALSGSRGSAITASIGIACVVAIIGRRSFPAMVVALAIALFGAFAVEGLTPESWERILTARQQLAGGTLGQRIPIWLAGLDVIGRHPIFGVGVGSFPAAVAPDLGYGIVAHNTPIEVVAEGGAIGAIIFFGAFAVMAYGVARNAVPQRWLALSLVLVWIVGTSSLSWEYRKTTWLILLVGAAVGRLRPAGAGAGAA